MANGASNDAILDLYIDLLASEDMLNRRVESALAEHSRVVARILEEFRLNMGLEPPQLRRQQAQSIRRPLQDITNVVNNENQ